MKEAAPSKNPAVSVIIDASLVPRFQKTPNRKTVVMGGARSAAMTLIASKILENLPPWVDQRIASSITMTELARPTCTSAPSVVCGRSRFTMSMATSVPELLIAAEIALISAASTAAAIRPFSPVGTSWLIRTGRVWLLLVPMMSRKSTNAITPGRTKKKTGRIFKKPASSGPNCASRSVFAPRTRCTMV